MEAVEKIFLVGGGGFIGANIRYWLGGWIQSRLGSTFPWQTLFINVSGSIVIGLLLGLISALNWHSNWRLFGAIGILGGYTTFSSFAYEALDLISKREYLRGFLYIEGSAVLTVFGAWIGLVIARLISGGRI